MKYRPENWDNPYMDTGFEEEFNIYEAGADAEWQAVQNKIAKISEEAGKDDRLFRTMVFLWLTKEGG